MVDQPQYSVADLEAYIAACFADLQRVDPRVRELISTLREPLADWEVQWFLKGCREMNLFRVEVRRASGGAFAASWVVSEMLTDPDGTPINLHFLETAGPRDAGARRVGREAITQLAASSLLVGEYGQDVSRIRTLKSEQAMDILVFDRPAREAGAKQVIACEVKVRGDEMVELVVGMQACGGRLDEAHHGLAVLELTRRPAGHVSNHHKKCRWLAAKSTARVFWAISRDGSRAFVVDRPSDGGFTLEDRGLDVLGSTTCA